MNRQPWIGVDLDGTLAEYHGWVSGDHIGEPIPIMVNRVKEWLKKGIKVKLFTARADDATAEQLNIIRNWCHVYIGQELEITCKKDYAMIELWDDRAVTVCENKGIAARFQIDGKLVRLWV